MDMADPIKVDSHVHLYRSKAEGQADKDGYEIWEYGGKSGVAFSDCFGTVDEVLTEMAAAGISKSVVVNLFVGQEIRAHMREALPDTLTASAREQANAEIEAEIADALGAFNRWICEVSRAHAEIVPFIGVDVTVLAGEPVATYVRDMVENHGGRGVKLHCASQKFSMSDERLWPMYAACEELGVAIIGHSGPTSGAGFAEPSFGALEAFPDLGIVARAALEIAETYPNAYFAADHRMEGENAPTAARGSTSGRT